VNGTVIDTTSTIDLTGIFIAEITWGLLFIFIGIFSIRLATTIQNVLGLSAFIGVMIPVLIGLGQFRQGNFDLANFLYFVVFAFVNTLIGNAISNYVMPILRGIYDFFYDLFDNLRG
jgi:hypothetical protein